MQDRPAPRKTSLVIFRAFGTDVTLHASFFLVPGILVAPGILAGDFQGAGFEAGIILLVYLSVLAHEYGHVAAARVAGVRTPAIVLHAIGGLALMNKPPDGWPARLGTSLAGPLVSAFIAAASFGLEALRTGNLESPDPYSPPALIILGLVNLVIVALNMLPIYPLDGGQALRALMTPALGDRKAETASDVIGVITGSVAAFAAFSWGVYLMAALLAAAGVFAASRLFEKVRSARQG